MASARSECGETPGSRATQDLSCHPIRGVVTMGLGKGHRPPNNPECTDRFGTSPTGRHCRVWLSETTSTWRSCTRAPRSPAHIWPSPISSGARCGSLPRHPQQLAIPGSRPADGCGARAARERRRRCETCPHVRARERPCPKTAGAASRCSGGPPVSWTSSSGPPQPVLHEPRDVQRIALDDPRDVAG
jgi:hypothetical protein